MRDTIHTGGGKTRTNVSVDAELLALAQELRINVSAALEVRLKELVAENRWRVWCEEHKGAIEDANSSQSQNYEHTSSPVIPEISEGNYPESRRLTPARSAQRRARTISAASRTRHPGLGRENAYAFSR